MKLSFDTKGNEKQYKACQAWANDEVFEVYYGGAKFGGKSFLGCNLIFSDAYTYPGTHYFIARKDLSDLKKHTIPSINEVFEIWGLSNKYYNFNATDNIYTLYNNSKVYLLYAKHLPSDPLYERFGSMQMTRGWIEEGGEFNEDSYKNLKISIGRWKNDLYNLSPKLLTTCNPKKNYIYRNVYKPFKNNALQSNIVFIQALPQDNKQASEVYIKNLQDTLTGSARQRLLLGNWEYDDDDNFLIDSYDKILDIFTINYLTAGKKYIICDAARFGSDRAIIGVFDELKLIDYYIFDKSKTTEISDKIKELQIKHKVPNSRTLVDSDGVGGGVVDEVGCVGFVNNARPIQDEETTNIKDIPNYDNIKSQCAFELAKVINDGELSIQSGLIPDNEKEIIIEELEQLKRQDDDKQLKLISKSDMKDNIARSPDWLDLFIMRMYFNIKEPDKYLYDKNTLNYYDGEVSGNKIGIIIPASKQGLKYLLLIVTVNEDKYYLTDLIYSSNDTNIRDNIVIKSNESKLEYLKFEGSNSTKDLYRHLKMNIDASMKSNFSPVNAESRIIIQSDFILNNFCYKKTQTDDYKLFMVDLCKYLKDGKNNSHDAPNGLSSLSEFIKRIYGIY